ncbi:MAG TPA: PQQ-binding-like beta-propeller repeat protein [Tepidisphaeraceae bacterium]|jgi:outer membrane protein assembly factor BamB|nr:PQQ-binding-like beta-propeller repeat protein [Tepidisphaeraceae bacterium]
MRFTSLLFILVLIASTAPASADGHRFLVADYSTKRIAILDPAGKIEWEYRISDLHDLHLLPSGNVLFQTTMTHLLEVDPKTNKIIWEYDAQKMNDDGKKVEVHAFQRLPDGKTMIVESGRARIIEVNKEGQITKLIRLKVDHPSTHSDTRLARKLETGHYLVAHEADGKVREYDANGAVTWEYEVPLFDKPKKGGHGPESWGNSLFSALRLPTGNTLIATGNGHGIIEVTPAKEIVWRLSQDDLPNIKLAWVTTLQLLPNGHIVLGNCHAGKSQPQIVEITKDKKVIWTWHDFDRFGDATSNSCIIDAQ